MSEDLSANYKGAFGKRIGYGKKPALIMIDFVEAYFEQELRALCGVEETLASASRCRPWRDKPMCR